MTTNTIKLLDVVALTVDLPEYNLWRGQVGTVVQTLANATAFEIEFSDRSGRTYESVGLRPEQIMVLRFEQVSPAGNTKTVELVRIDEKSLSVRRLGPGRKSFGGTTVRLEPDVAEMFPNADAVNEALRFLIRVMQENKPPAPKTHLNTALEPNE